MAKCSVDNLHGNTYSEECREAKSIKGNFEVLRFPTDNLDDIVIKSSLFDLWEIIILILKLI